MKNFRELAGWCLVFPLFFFITDANQLFHKSKVCNGHLYLELSAWHRLWLYLEIGETFRLRVSNLKRGPLKFGEIYRAWHANFLPKDTHSSLNWALIYVTWVMKISKNIRGGFPRKLDEYWIIFFDLLVEPWTISSFLVPSFSSNLPKGWIQFVHILQDCKKRSFLTFLLAKNHFLKLVRNCYLTLSL